MLDSYVEFAMETARADVALGRGVFMNATVIDSQNKLIIIGATNLQTERDKDGWCDLIKQKVAEFHGQAVVITAGVSRAVYSPEGEEKVRQLLKAGVELGVTDSYNLGLCEKVDAILVSLHTPLETKVYAQDYKVVEGKVVFGEKIEAKTAEGMLFIGRLAGFFDPMPQGKPC